MLSAGAQTSEPLSWYHNLKGKVGEYPVTMHLYKKDKEYFAYYYYESKQEPIMLSGKMEKVAGVPMLVLSTGGENNESLSFTLKEGVASGTWTMKNKPRLAFSAMEAKVPIAFTYVYTKGTTQLRPKMKNSPEANFEASSVWPLGTGVIQDSVRSVIRSAFGFERSREEIGALLLNSKKDFFKGYREAFFDVKDADLGASTNYDESSNQYIQFSYICRGRSYTTSSC
jgi:hypothetical protein